MRNRLAACASVGVILAVSFLTTAIVTQARLRAAPPLQQGKGGGPLPAGQYHFTSTGADFFQFFAPPATQLTIFVNASTQQSNPLVGPSSTTSETDVSFETTDGTSFMAACFILGTPSDFTLARDLQSAALHTTFTTASQACEGMSNNFPLPLTLDVAWSGLNAVLTTRDVKRFDCLTYSSTALLTNAGNNATATATLSSMPGNVFTSAQAGLSSNDQRESVQGTFQPACAFLGPGGKGAGPGAPPAGNYHATSSQASVSATDPTGSPVEIRVNSSTNTSMPLGGPATSTAETDVFVSTADGFGCYVLGTATDFTHNGLQSAALHTVITDATAACQGSFNNLSLPLTIDATWTGVGPVASNSDTTTLACLTYRLEGNGTESAISASATLSVSPLSGPLTLGEAGLGSSDQSSHAQGVEQDACIFRS